MATSKKTSASVKKQAKAIEKQEPSNTVKREQWIKDSAYFMAESRGFLPGYDQEDWKKATKKYDSSFSSTSLS